MKKRLLAILLAVCLLAGMFPLAASAADADGSCGENLTWEFVSTGATGYLTVSGTGEMDDWNWDANPPVIPPWASDGNRTDWRLRFLDIFIQPGVTSIGSDAFAGCRYLVTVSLPEGLTHIGDDAFYVCEGIREITLPNSLLSMDENAFYGCTDLKTVTLSRSLYNRLDKGKIFAKCREITFKDSADGSTIAVFTPEEEDVDPGAVPVTGVRLDRTELTLTPGESERLDAEVLPADAENRNITWHSSDENVAVVDADGFVTAIAAGNATIEVRTEDGGFTAACTVTVKNKELSPIPFKDVADNAWYREAVGYAWENNLFSGTGDATFSPDAGMTRGMFITVLGRKTGIDTEQYMRYRFPDTKLGEYYAPYVEWASEYGIVDGTSKTTFSPNKKITREQMAAILYRYAQKTGNDVSCTTEEFLNFPDSGKVSGYAKTAMMWATSQGVLNGSNGKLNPQGTATRAQVAQVFKNCHGLLVNTEVTGTPSIVPEPKFTPVPIHKLANYKSLSKGMTTAEFTQAYNAAVKLVTPLNGYNRKSQLLNIAVELRQLFDSGIEYSMTAPHYADAYGYFISKKASCAGCTRATGLCLNILGYPYEHVNEGEWSHQWCRVKVGGEYWICDAYGLYCGPEPAPYKHPYLS